MCCKTLMWKTNINRRKTEDKQHLQKNMHIGHARKTSPRANNACGCDERRLLEENQKKTNSNEQTCVSNNFQKTGKGSKETGENITEILKKRKRYSQK